LPSFMIHSRAVSELSLAARWVLILFLEKVKTSDDRFSVEFAFTFAEAKKDGIPNDTFHRSVSQLIKYGFIMRVKRGGIIGFEGKKENTYYRLSQRWETYGTDKFIEIHDGFEERLHGSDKIIP